MVWNYRVVKRIEKRTTGPDEVMYYIHEAFYPERGAEPDSITMEPIVICGEGIDNMRWQLESILGCLKKPVLNYEDF